MSKTITQEEVAKHNSEGNGVWIVIDGNVYDMSSLYWPLLKRPQLNVCLVLMSILEGRRFSFVLLERTLVNKYFLPCRFLCLRDHC